MVQATTPTFILTLPNDIDLGEAAHVYFTEDSDLTIDGNEVSVYLSQAETVKLSVGAALLQLNWTYANSARACSNIVSVQVTENLLKEVVQ